jgi:hypothetical protein
MLRPISAYGFPQKQMTSETKGDLVPVGINSGQKYFLIYGAQAV